MQLDVNIDIGSGQILPFRTIKSNVGNGYDVNTFKFKPPHNGTYEFALQIMARAASYSKAEITVNGLDQCRAHIGPGMNVHPAGSLVNSTFLRRSENGIFPIYLRMQQIFKYMHMVRTPFLLENL